MPSGRNQNSVSAPRCHSRDQNNLTGFGSHNENSSGLSNLSPSNNRGGLNRLARHHNALSSLKGNHPNTRSSKQSRGSSSGDGYSRAAASRDIKLGSRIRRTGGKQSIARGRSAAAMGVTTFLRIASRCLSVANTSSASVTARLCTWVIRVSSSAAFRS